MTTASQFSGSYEAIFWMVKATNVIIMIMIIIDTVAQESRDRMRCTKSNHSNNNNNNNNNKCLYRSSRGAVHLTPPRLFFERSLGFI